MEGAPVSAPALTVPRIVEVTPPKVQAALIRRVLEQQHPKLALGAIASNAHLTIADLQTLLGHHGYPDRTRLTQAATRLETAAPAPTADDTTEAQPPGEVLRTVPVAQLRADPDNPRDHITDAAVADLADSIAEVGLLQPIVARQHGNQLVIVAGHRRLTAVKLLGWREVNVIIRAAMRPDHVLAAMLIENGQRRDLNPIEEARGLRRLKAETDCSDLELARKIGRSQPHVSGRLALLSLSAEEQKAIIAGDMTLIEGVHKGRLNSGKVTKKGQDKNWHLGPAHDLAERAKARCEQLKQPRGRKVGGMACGSCWESVIRADERDHLHVVSAKQGSCVTCGAIVEPVATS